MRLRGTLLAGLALAAVSLTQAQPLKPMDEAGYRAALASNKGNVVLFDFWATWCDPCRAEMPQLAKLEAKLRGRGFKLITISCDEPEAEASAADFLKKNGVVQPAYMKRAKNDDAFINAIDPKWSGALPALFLYDRQGRRVASFVGETSMATVEAALQKAL